MPMQAETVDILVEKAHFETRIERLGSELRVEIHGVKSDLLRHTYAAIATQMAPLLGIAYLFCLHVK